MAETTNIQWTNYTGGPFLGCAPVSPGCAKCYAWELALTRLEPLFRKAYKAAGFADWDTRPVWGKNATRVLTKGFWRDARRINAQHARAGTHGRWFPSLIDWLDEMAGGIIDQEGNRLDPFAVLADFLSLVHDTANLDWLLLTKRPQNFPDRIARALRFWGEEPGDNEAITIWLHDWLTGEAPANVWVGVSIEDQPNMQRHAWLMDIPARVHFWSAEPLLGFLETRAAWAKHGLPDWVIIGNESGRGARDGQVEAVDDLRRQCQAAGVRCFVKQLGSRPIVSNANILDWPPGTVFYANDGDGAASARVSLRDSKGGDPNEWPEDLRVRQFPQFCPATIASSAL